MVQTLAAGHRRMGHEVRVAAVVDRGQVDHPFLRPLRDADVEVYPICIHPKAYWRERRLVGDLCARLRPDAVHTHGDRPDVVDAGVARRLGMATVTTLHGASHFTGRARLYNWLQRVALKKFDAVVAVSRALADSAADCGVSPERVHVLPNVWTPTQAVLDAHAARRTLGLARHAYVLGWVGRLIRVKGCDIFLRALANLKDLPVEAVIIGDGPERSSLESLASSLGLQGRVKFVGQVDTAAPLFSAFDLFVLSSTSEGTPLTLLEAMAAGVPVIATRVGGVPDVLSSDEALLVRPGDVEDLTLAIRGVHAQAGEARSRAERARRRVATAYALEPWLAKYEDIYRLIRH